VSESEQRKRGLRTNNAAAGHAHILLDSENMPSANMVAPLTAPDTDTPFFPPRTMLLKHALRSAHSKGHTGRRNYRRSGSARTQR
jgi:hypothetical protein